MSSPLRAIQPALLAADYLVGHSLPGDLDYLIRARLAKGEWISGKKILDSYLLARLRDENREGKGAYKLQTLMLSDFNVQPWKDETEAIGTDATKWTEKQRLDRCQKDAWGSVVLAEKDAKALRVEGIPWRYIEYTHRLSMSMHRVWLAGAIIDLSAFNLLGQEFGRKSMRGRALLTNHARKHGMKTFVPTNDNHLRQLLFRKLKLRPLWKTEVAGLPKVNKLTLEQYEDHPVVKALIEFNHFDKLYSTWYGRELEEGAVRKTVPLKDLIHPCGVLCEPNVRTPVGYHQFRINTLGTRTHRRSGGGTKDSKNPQNWPDYVRQIVRSRFPNGKILGVDYSRLEVILMAWTAQDGKLMDYFLKGDGYIGVAKELFGVTPEKGTSEYKIAKQIVLGTDYGMQDWKFAFTLWYVLKIKLSQDWKRHLQKAAGLRARYFKMFPGVGQYLRDRTQEVLRTGRIVAATGAVRHLPCPDGRDTPEFWHIEHQAANFPIQHLASVVTGSAVLDVEEEICRAYRYSLGDYHRILLMERDKLLSAPVEMPKLDPIPRLVNEVHDEILFDLSRAKDQELIVETMRSPRMLRVLVPDLKIRFNVDAQLGATWRKGNAEEERQEEGPSRPSGQRARAR